MTWFPAAKAVPGAVNTHGPAWLAVNATGCADTGFWQVIVQWSIVRFVLGTTGGLLGLPEMLAALMPLAPGGAVIRQFWMRVLFALTLTL